MSDAHASHLAYDHLHITFYPLLISRRLRVTKGQLVLIFSR